MKVTIRGAETNLSRLLQHVAQGEEVTVCRGKQPVAKLVPDSAPRAVRPKVGQPTSARFVIPKGAFLPLQEDELAEWGI